MKLRYKLLLLGVGLTVVIMFVAGLFSYVLYRQKTLNDLFRTIDNSLVELEETFSDDNHLSELVSLKNYIIDTYEADPDATVGLEGEELYEKCRDIYYKLYSKKPGIIGLSHEDAELRQNYFALSGIMDNSFIAPGVVNSFICYFDGARERMVYLIDSQYGLDTKLYDTMILPGAFYKIKQSDEVFFKEESLFPEYYLNGGYYKYTDIFAVENQGTDSESREYVASVFINYDTAVAEKSINSFLVTELIAMSVGAVVLSVLFILLSHFIFTKNVSKLNRSAKAFTESMASGAKLSVINPGVKSRDEIGILSHSVITMEEGIIAYAGKIENDAKERERLNAELSIAQEIQNEALPNGCFADGKVSVSADISPAKQVGGDFYDYFYIDENKFAVVVADVSGKGVPAALFMMKAKSLIKSKLSECGDVQKTAFYVNNALMENNKAGLFVTAFIGIIDVKTGIMTYVSAGHERPYLVGENVKRLEVCANFVLGGQKNFEFIADTVDVSGFDLFLYTDGLNEAVNSNTEEFGYERIEKSLSEFGGDKVTKIKRDLKEFVGDEEPFDDVTLMLVGLGGGKLDLHFTEPDYSAIETVIDEFNKMFSYAGKETLAKVGIIIDEVLNNFISYESKENHKVSFSATEKDGVITMRFTSDGEEFDPLKNAKEKYINGDEKDIAAGGFGISITKTLSDEISYERVDGENVITILKKIV